MTLDNLSQIKNLDKSNMLGSIEALAEQCREAWDDLKGLNLPRTYQQAKNIVAAGMGASALGGRIIDSLYGAELKMPMEIVNEYHLPAYVSKETLVIISSYSGSTEETLSCLDEALKKQAKILIITSGNGLADEMSKHKIPGYLFVPRHNPCRSPRMGLGYSLFGLLIIFGKLELISFGEKEAEKAIRIVEKNNRLFQASILTKENQAKQLAQKIFGKMPFFFAAMWLAGNLRAAANQLNENAKVFNGWFLLPEANHHLMEGLVFPPAIKNDLCFVFFESALDEPKMLKRVALTKEAAEKAGIKTVSCLLREKTKLEQAFEFLVLGSYLSFYLAMLNDTDPTPIPMVDWFKKRI